MIGFVGLRALERAGIVLLMSTAVATAASAQWLDYPTPGIPRTESGAPDPHGEIPFHGEPLRIIGVEDFIAMKLFRAWPARSR